MATVSRASERLGTSAISGCRRTRTTTETRCVDIGLELAKEIWNRCLVGYHRPLGQPVWCSVEHSIIRCDYSVKKQHTESLLLFFAAAAVVHRPTNGGDRPASSRGGLQFFMMNVADYSSLQQAPAPSDSYISS